MRYFPRLTTIYLIFMTIFKMRTGPNENKPTMSFIADYKAKVSDVKSFVPSATLSHVIENKNANAPIGVFDSGIGGLSVYLHLAKQLPFEQYIYYADTLHVPYGTRDSEDIERLTLVAVEWLYQRGCKLIVIACNSASAHALETARRYYPKLPIVGLVPALKPAVQASKSGHVAVLATRATLNGSLLNQVITDIAVPSATEVTKYFDPHLVPWVEAGMPKDSDTAYRLQEQLHLFAQENVDQVVLGCTHYPFFKNFLLQTIETNQLSMEIVDSGEAIAQRVKQILAYYQLLAPSVRKLSIKATDRTSINKRLNLMLHASKPDADLDNIIQRLLGEHICVQHCL